MKIIRKMAGSILFIMGVFALVLPIIPGWLLIALGLYILSLDSPGLDRRLRVLRSRFPHIDRLLSKHDGRFSKTPPLEGPPTP